MYGAVQNRELGEDVFSSRFKRAVEQAQAAEDVLARYGPELDADVVMPCPSCAVVWVIGDVTNNARPVDCCVCDEMVACNRSFCRGTRHFTTCACNTAVACARCTRDHVNAEWCSECGQLLCDDCTRECTRCSDLHCVDCACF